MKKFLFLSLFTLALALGSRAQVIFGLQGSYLTGTSSEKNNQWGGGLQFKGKISNRLALGGILRSYIKNYNETKEGDLTVRTADNVTQLAGMLEYYFGRKVQPYIGTDAGLYFTSHIVEGSNSGTPIDISGNKTYFGIAPKAGIQFNTGLISPFIQAQYHYLFGGGDEIVIPGVGGTPIDTKTVDKFWTIDFGILFQFGKVGGKK